MKLASGGGFSFPKRETLSYQLRVDVETRNPPSAEMAPGESLAGQQGERALSTDFCLTPVGAGHSGGHTPLLSPPLPLPPAVLGVTLPSKSQGTVPPEHSHRPSHSGPSQHWQLSTQGIGPAPRWPAPGTRRTRYRHPPALSASQESPERSGVLYKVSKLTKQEKSLPRNKTGHVDFS